jgi:hypothetical protein
LFAVTYEEEQKNLLSSEKPINHKNASVTTHSCPSLPGFTNNKNLLAVNTVREV